MAEWQLAEAKNKLSEVVTRALSEGPQRIQRRGEAVIVLSEAEYEKLTGKTGTLKDWLFSEPDFSDLDLERDKSLMRDVSW